MPPQWLQPSDYPPISKPTHAHAASASGSVSTPSFASPWMLTFAVSVALAQRRQQVHKSPPNPLLRLQWQHPLNLQSRPNLPVVRSISPLPGSVARSAGSWSASASAELSPGYGAKPHVQALTRGGPTQRLPAVPTRPNLAIHGPALVSDVSVTFAQAGGSSRAQRPPSNGGYSCPDKPVFGIQGDGNYPDYPDYPENSIESIISKGLR